MKTALTATLAIIVALTATAQEGVNLEPTPDGSGAALTWRTRFGRGAKAATVNTGTHLWRNKGKYTIGLIVANILDRAGVYEDIGDGVQDLVDAARGKSKSSPDPEPDPPPVEPDLPPAPANPPLADVPPPEPAITVDVDASGGAVVVINVGGEEGADASSHDYSNSEG